MLEHRPAGATLSIGENYTVIVMSKPKDPKIDPALVRFLLEYDEKTGSLTWRERPKWMFSPTMGYRSHKIWNGRYAGKPALTCDNGTHLSGGLFDKTVRTHRVVWVWWHGEWNKTDIDHINGDYKDNRIVNLREVSHAINGRNQKLRSTNTSGVMGVDYLKKYDVWRARIMVDGVTINLGRFKTKEEAIKVRKEAEPEYSFHINHGR